MMGFGSELKAHAWRSIPRVATVQRASLATPQSLSSSSRRFDWLTRFCVCSHSIRNHPRILLLLDGVKPCDGSYTCSCAGCEIDRHRRVLRGVRPSSWLPKREAA